MDHTGPPHGKTVGMIPPKLPAATSGAAKVKALLRRYGLRPSKGLAQRFLTDEGVLARILVASDLAIDDLVLEIGPGLGLLTRCLADRVSRLVAVELDRKMVKVLAETLDGRANVHIVHGDILEIDFVAEMMTVAGLQEEALLSYKVVANLPYYITSVVLRRLLNARVRPTQLTLMVQREVAQRIVSKPGSLSLLAISVQVFGLPKIVCRVPANAFYPPPKVDSALLNVQLYESPRVPQGDLARFFRVVRAGFGQKRKQLHNSLTHNLRLPRDTVLAALEEAGIAPQRRPQTLGIEEWTALASALYPTPTPRSLASPGSATRARGGDRGER